MKKIIVSFILLVVASQILFAGEIKLDGIFQGKNIYVMNPYSSSGVGFCVYEVTVNGQIATDEINSSAFEIDFSSYQLKVGDKLTLIVKHKENCTPKILNSEVLKPRSSFNTTLIKVEKDETLKWTTTGEAGKLDFVVEQFRWNKWVKVGEVDGKGTDGQNNYSIKVNTHSGSNKFRVKQIDYTKKPRYSDEAMFRSMQPEVTFTPKKVSTEIIFSAETMYEIYDNYGTIVLKGTATKVDVTGLTKGKYYLNYDNVMAEFTKK